MCINDRVSGSASERCQRSVVSRPRSLSFRQCRACSAKSQRSVTASTDAAVPRDVSVVPYSESKAAVARPSQRRAAEQVGRENSINIVRPAIIDTPVSRASKPDSDPAAWTHLGRIAEVAAFREG